MPMADFHLAYSSTGVGERGFFLESQGEEERLYLSFLREEVLALLYQLFGPAHGRQSWGSEKSVKAVRLES